MDFPYGKSLLLYKGSGISTEKSGGRFPQRNHSLDVVLHYDQPINMIKFFRKIRQKLLDEGTLKRYLFYAIGEIALVMAGILLALQVNNWNEGRRNYKGETIALIELRNEFDSNYKSFLEVLDRKKKAKIERGQVAIISWDSGNAVLNSLLSTGKIEYIKNDSLKYLLHDWNRVVYGFDEHAITYKDIVYELINYE